jgi:hypothetical protein
LAQSSGVYILQQQRGKKTSGDQVGKKQETNFNLEPSKKSSLNSDRDSGSTESITEKYRARLW